MLVSQYHYPTSGPHHTAYYTGGCRGGGDGGYSHPLEGHTTGVPHTESSYPGGHQIGGPIPRAGNGGGVSGAPHSGGISMANSRDQGMGGAPSSTGYQGGAVMASSHGLGQYGCDSLRGPSGSRGGGGGSGGHLVPEYLGGSITGPAAGYSAPLMYPSHQPSTSLEQGAAPYLNPGGQPFHYHPYGPHEEASHGYDRQLCPPGRPSHPVPQSHHMYPAGGRGSACVPYPGFLQHQQQQQQCGEQQQVALKVEPESNPWHEELDLLSHLQQVRLQSDDPPPSRDSSKPRRKRRTSEKRKENSRVAARCRRDKESKLFEELANQLPLPTQTISQLDKASIMRLTNSVLKTCLLCQAGFSKAIESKGSKLDQEMDGLHMKALDGFLLALSTDGDIVYTSENISTFLGLQQIDVMGQSLFDYTHPCDHDEVRDMMATRTTNSQPRHAFLRFKCTLTPKGRSVNLKSATYKVVQVNGELVGKKEEQTWLVALATPVPHPSNIEFPLNKQTFVSRHSLDMKFTYVDDNVEGFCGYVADELVGRSLYEMHHALDSDLVKEAYKILRNKGQVETGRYRFLARGGGYVWLVTQATLIHGPKDQKPQYVVCLNYVVSGIESRGVILSELQLLCSADDNSNNNSNKCSKKVSPAPVATPPVLKDVATPPVLKDVAPPVPATPAVPPSRTHTQQKVCDGVVVPTPRVTPAPPPRPPVANTFKIFTPRTKDMNKGYLTFSKDNPQGTVLKEEPEDLTHLAPSVGDTCVPLLECASFNSGLEEDQCMPQEVTTLDPNLDDMFNLDYQMPIANSDVLIASPDPVKTEELDSSQKYLYDESRLPGGVKCMNSLSGGHLVLQQSDCSSPSSQDSSSLHPSNLSTPEPPKPILTEAALSPVPHRKLPPVFGASRPRTTTESFFTNLDESQTQGSSPELFGKLDIKLDNQNMDADEFEMRAPYIPYSNEDLMLGPDDLLWGAEPEPSIITKHCPTATRDSQCCNLGLGEKEDSSLAQLLRDTDPTITGGQGRNLHLDNSPGTQRNQYQQSKFLDGGGNFVDPNKVLPGHFARKEEVEGGRRRNQLVDPPPALVQDPVEPPPPLVALDTKQVSSSVKRGHSPLASPTLTHKKMCSLSCQPESNPRQREERLGKQGGVRLLTPYAPTMQQLLVSKEPITVRGGRPGGGLSASRNSVSDENHSVLRNLLNMSGESSQVVSEGQSSGGGGGGGGGLHLARDKMATMVVTSGGGGTMGSLLTYHPKLSLVTDSMTGIPEGHLTFKLTSASGGEGGGVGGRRGHRQDPLLLMNPDTTITNLLDLTQQDCEVNAPANNCNLLQGADLLMALDQSL